MFKSLRLIALGLLCVLSSYTVVYSQENGAPIPLENTDYKFFLLTPSIGTSEKSLKIDEVTKIKIEFHSTDDGIVPSIIGPSGQVVNEQNVGGYGGTFSKYVIPDSVSPAGPGVITPASLPEGIHYIFEFPTLGVGTYTLRVQAPPNLAGDIAIASRTTTDSDIKVKLISTQSEALLGNPMVLTAFVFK
jgi:hypothetical protein